MPQSRIAIIGSGIAGLSSAYWLSQQSDVQVTLLEKLARIGMDAHRIELNLDEQVLPIDVPSRMFNAAGWPRLVDLYQQIGVNYEPVDPTQSMSLFSGNGSANASTYLKLDVAFRPELTLRQMVKAKSRKLLSEAARLMKQGRKDLDTGLDKSMTLDDYLSKNNYSISFRHEFLYPTLSSTVCTCSFESLDHYPAWVVLAALRRLTDDRGLMRTSGGTADVVSRLSSGLTDVRTNYAVSSIIQGEHSVQVSSHAGEPEEFDHVIVATQANTALTFLPRIDDQDGKVLRSIPYENVPVVVHRDTRLMPAKQSDWCTFNMGVVADGQHSAMCSVWLNRFHNWQETPNVFQTIAPVIEPDSSAIISEIKLQRPVVNSQSMRALQQLQQIHSEPERRIWYCGSWAAPGIPLLETGVVSAQSVVKSITSSRSHAV